MMQFDLSWDADNGVWVIGVGEGWNGLYGRGASLSEAWADLIEFLQFDPRELA